MTIRPVEKEDLKVITKERNKVMETLRTPFMLNYDQQLDYFNKTLCNRDSRTRYFVFMNNGFAVGFGGIENIEWENSRGEISLIIYSQYRGKGLGMEAVELILDQGFNYINLDVLWLECYRCAPWQFWEKTIAKIHKKNKIKFKPKVLWLPDRKFINGEYHESFYVNLRKVR